MTEGRTMTGGRTMTYGTRVRHFSGKLAAFALVLVCVALGLIGLVLPIIPGLLFLAVAALIVVKHFPSLAARMRRHKTIGRPMSRADRLARLSLPEQIKLAGLLGARALLDGLALTGTAALRFTALVRGAFTGGR